MAKIVSIEEAVGLVKPGDKVSFNGFLGISTPVKLFEGLEKAGTGDLTMVSAVMSFPFEEHGVSKLVVNKQVKKLIAAHAGTSKEITKQYFAGELEINFIPMGTLTEMLHAGGAGLGAVVTPVGVGTMQEETYEKIERNGKEYLVYDPLTTDVAFLKVNKVDKEGNAYCHGTTKTQALEMALAGKTVIVEADEIVEVGEISPTDVYIPGMLVDYIVQGMNPEERREYYGELWGKYNLLSKGGN